MQRDMRRALWLLLLTACASNNSNRVTSFEREADELRRALHIPGMSAAIVQNQQVVWTRGFGYADLENRVPATPDTLYHVASVTKTFGATLVMQLVESGQLTLEEPMSTPTRVRFLREGTSVTGLEFTFGEGEEPIRAKKIR